MTNISVEVVFALPDKQFLLHVKLTKGANIKEAIMQSGILMLHNDINLSKNKIGIYGRLAKLSDILSDGDRVEIYRPLLMDPKEMRRKRAEKQRKIK